MLNEQLNEPDIEDFIVTIYNVEKWGFSPYCQLNRHFQSKYDCGAYVELISNIRKSVTKYVNDESETLWTIQYKNCIKIQIILYIVAILLAIIGTFTVPLLYMTNMIGLACIICGITICSIGLSICGILYYRNKSHDFIKRYKILIFNIISNGLNTLNILYSNKAIFKIINIISTRSLCNFILDLDIYLKIILLCNNIDRQYNTINQNQPAVVNNDDKTSSSDTENNIHGENVSNGAIGSPSLRIVIDEYNQPPKSANNNYNHYDNYDIEEEGSNTKDIEIMRSTSRDLDEEHKSSMIEMTLSTNSMHTIGENIDITYSELKHDEEKYIEIINDKHENMNMKQSDNIDILFQFNLFHSYKALDNIINLVERYDSNNTYDLTYNYYNLGVIIGKYFNEIFKDNNIVVIVSDMNKQPQLSYVSQPNFERKIKNLNGKDILIYRALNYIKLNVHKQHKYNKDLNSDFKQMVLKLSNIYKNTKQIALELDNIYGGGCHVARAPYNKYNVFCTYSHQLITRCFSDDGTYIIAWRR